MNQIEVFMALDLELNQPSAKIIELGACVGNIKTGQIFEKFSSFVNPLEKINPFITNLTKITQQDVDNAPLLEEAYHKLKKIHEKYNCFVNPITWGGGDSVELLNQLKQDNQHFDPANWCFGRRWIDTKTLFVSWRFSRGEPIQGGLGRSMTKLGLKFEGRQHSAGDDSLNTFRMYCAMLKKFRE